MCKHCNIQQNLGSFFFEILPATSSCPKLLKFFSVSSIPARLLAFFGCSFLFLHYGKLFPVKSGVTLVSTLLASLFRRVTALSCPLYNFWNHFLICFLNFLVDYNGELRMILVSPSQLVVLYILNIFSFILYSITKYF